MKKNLAEEKAFQVFAEVLIKNLETMEVGEWEKPWVFGSGDGCNMWPKNMDGREYASNNALILLMHTRNNGYTAPIYATFERISRLNYKDASKTERLKDEEGKELPFVMVNKGSESMPVLKTLYTPVHSKTHQRISYAEYMELDEEEKKEYNVFPRTIVYKVFNIDQTNLRSTRPELYAQLTQKTQNNVEVLDDGEDVTVPAVDVMIAKNLWQCEIEVRYGNSAYYSPSEDLVVIPQKGQFTRKESYYGTLFHECAHSTGASNRYSRNLGEKSRYAQEELIAELTAALVASRYGLDKHVKADSMPYLKNWLQNLREEPDFIKRLLNDVKKASSQIIRRLDVIQDRIEELEKCGVMNPLSVEDFLELNEDGQPVRDPAKYSTKCYAKIEETEEIEAGV